jgi:hypothetical protein
VSVPIIASNHPILHAKNDQAYPIGNDLLSAVCIWQRRRGTWCACGTQRLGLDPGSAKIRSAAAAAAQPIGCAVYECPWSSASSLEVPANEANTSAVASVADSGRMPPAGRAFGGARNRTRLVLFDTNNRIIGPYSAAMDRARTTQQPRLGAGVCPRGQAQPLHYREEQDAPGPI